MSPFQQKLVRLIKDYVHYCYRLAKQFPRDELFGAMSQIKRASLSILLNYTEGFTRIKVKVQSNFFETAYGSLHESLIILDFVNEEGWITKVQNDQAKKMADEIGAMLWSEIESKNIE